MVDFLGRQCLPAQRRSNDDHGRARRIEVVRQGLGRYGRIPEPKGDPGGSIHDLLDLRRSGLIGRDVGESVLHDAQAYVVLSQDSSEGGHRRHGHAVVVRDDGDSRCLYQLSYLAYLFFFCRCWHCVLLSVFVSMGGQTRILEPETRGVGWRTVRAWWAASSDLGNLGGPG